MKRHTSRTTTNQRLRDTRRPRAVAIALLAGFALGGAAPPAGAARQPSQEAAQDARPFTGRDFAGLDLPAPPQQVDLTFGARRATVWSESGTRRLLLEQDVRVRIGVYDFRADRAVVWVEQVRAAGRDLEQIAVYFEHARDLGAAAAVAQSAERLLVTALVEGEVRLLADRVQRGRPVDAFLASAEERFGRYLATVADQQAPAEAPADGYASPTIVERRPLRRFDTEPPRPEFSLPDYVRTGPIFPEQGVISFFGPDRTLVTGEVEDALVITGGVVVQYSDVESGRTLQISADSLVVFFDPGSVADLVRFGPGDVRGLYLEGDVVATDGDYTIRGPRVFYDIANNRGVVLDAVFYTYDERRGMDLYVRADVIRQESANQWSAGRSRFTNVAFHEPVFTIGAQSLTLTRRTSADDQDARMFVDARDLTFNIAGAPVFGVPRYRGELGEAAPLRRASIETRNGDPIVRTQWRFRTLFGLDEDAPVDGDLLIDGFFDRGPAIGTDLHWGDDESTGGSGEFFSYYIHDRGRDLLTSGAEIDPGIDNRGMVLIEHQERINDQWFFSLEGAWISDETFVDAFFESMAESRREFANSGYVKWTDGSSVFTGEVRGVFNDFTSNEYLLQSLGYQVERLPEFTYHRLRDEFFGGAITHSSESSVSRLELQFTEPFVRELGFTSQRRSRAGFGLDPDDRISDRLRAAGVSESAITRFDSRHEFASTFNVGAFRFRPYLVGRVTAYDDDFSDFRGPGGSDEQVRLWGAAGASVSTSIIRIDNDVRSDLLDLNRIRHIIEPSVDLWSAATNIHREEFFVYDEDVESIAEGTAVRFGLTNTWQTKRGGPRHERSVDWLTLRTDYVYATDDTDRESPIGRYFNTRPELSNLGEYIVTDGVWRATDATAFAADAVYDLDVNDISTAAFGVLLDHGFGFTSYSELRHVDAIDSTFLSVGGGYEFTRRYALEASTAYDLETDAFQTISGTLTRRAAQWTLNLGVSYDDIRGDTNFRMRFSPAGFASDNRRRIFTRNVNKFGQPVERDDPFWRR